MRFNETGLRKTALTPALSRSTGRGGGRAAGVMACLLVVSAILLGGCQAAHVPDSAISAFPGDDASSQLAFWHDLAERKLTSNDDAFHGLLLYLDSTDPSTSYDQRVATLKSRGLLPAHFAEPGDLAIERGTLAYAIV